MKDANSIKIGKQGENDIIDPVDRVRKLEEELRSLKEQLEYEKKRLHVTENRICDLYQHNNRLQEYVTYYKKYHRISDAYIKVRLNLKTYRIMKFLERSNRFDEKYYLENNNDIRSGKIAPLDHFVRYGDREWRNPNDKFDTKYYLSTNKDVADDHINALYHYLKYGFKEGRKPSQDADMYLEWCMMEKGKNKHLQLPFILKNIYSIYKSGLFDGEYYLYQNKDVGEYLMNKKLWKLRKSRSKILRNIGRLTTSAISHYVRYGVYESRNPNPTFNTSFYINRNLDILKEKHINPFMHYIKYGKLEGRKQCEEGCTDEVSLCEYTNKCVQVYGKEILNSSVAIIITPSNKISELERRLESVDNQKWKNIEVIIMDYGKDSVITSRINVYIGQHKERTRRIKVSPTEVEQGSIWTKVLEGVTSQYIWILDENSVCQDEFLVTVVPYFADNTVKVVECKSEYVDFKQNITKTNSDKICIYGTTGQMEAIKLLEDDNLKYEMSGVVFKNPSSEIWFLNEKWKLHLDESFTYFILNILVMGKKIHIDKICHLKEITGQDINKNGRDFTKETYRVYEQLHSLLKSRYGITSEIIKREYEKMRTEYLTESGKTIDHFTGLYDIESVMNTPKMPRIMISIIAFTHGGGEIMPIRLANQLSEMGYSILVHNYKLQEDEIKVRQMLNPSIPVVEMNQVDGMRTIIKSFDVDVVSTHHQGVQSFIANTINGDSVLKEKINHVGTSHGMYENFSDEELRIIFERLADNVDYWTYVADKNIIPFKRFNLYNQEHFIKIPNGMKPPEVGQISRGELGISEEAFIICTVSRALKEKGWKEAIDSVEVARELTGKDIQLLLIGDGVVYEELSKKGTSDFVHLLGFKENPCDYYAISDLALLTSYYKSESAPLTIIEAFFAHIPVIASDIGDIRQMITIDDKLAGDIFELDNWTVPISVVGEKIADLVMNTEHYNQVKELATKKSKEFEIEEVAKKYLEVFTKKKRENSLEDHTEKSIEEINEANLILSNADRRIGSIKVSVIVPNYNHSKFLRKRLDCIYKQTYKNIEVILMDDCSTDNSREILNEYAQRYPNVTVTLFNELNSGGVFYQWCKGIERATGDVCWIAESDDYCELDFIEKLIPAFKDPKVRISYCQYVFVNENDEHNTNGFQNYVGIIDKEKWKHSYICDAQEEVDTALAIRNTIPNASGVLFRRPIEGELLKREEWLKMKICGDWIFYLHLLKGGKIAYTKETTSYFRFHTNNSSAATYTKPIYYKEHEAVAYTIKQLYNVSDETLYKNYNIIKEFYDRNVKDKNMDFRKLYDIKSILGISKKESVQITVKEPKIINKNKGKEFNTVLINPIFSAGKNMDSNVQEKVRYTGNNTGNLLFVESMKEQLNYEKETWIRASDFSKIQNVSAVMPSSNFIINGGDDFILQCMQLLEETTCPITLAGLGAQSSKELNTPKKLVEALTPTKIKYFKMIAERATSLGIRGEFTAQCLEEMGIHNYRIIGCPSAYKYLDGVYKKIKTPTSERIMFTTTTGNEYERKIVELGMENNATWIMQMMTEMPEVALESKMPNAKWMQIRFPGINVTPEELKAYMENKAKMFFRINDWYEFYEENQFTFSFGSRFHGNMSALRSGIPALWIVHDSRTTELVNTLKLPNIDFKTFDTITSIEQLIEYCNYDEFYKNYGRLTKEYMNFLEENNLNHKFSDLI